MFITKKAEMRKQAKPPSLNMEDNLQLYEGTKQEQLMRLYEDWEGCTSCELGKVRQLAAPGKGIVFGDGSPDAHIIIIGEAPGEEEEEYGMPFIGLSGMIMNQLIARSSDDKTIQEAYTYYNSLRKKSEEAVQDFTDTMVNYRQKHFFMTNVVSCRPPENRPPTPGEIKICWERVWNIIYIVDPLLIIACGNTALATVTKRMTAKIAKERGDVKDVSHDGRFGKVIYPVIPIHGAGYLRRKADWNVKGGDWQKTDEDFKKAMRLVDRLRFQNYGTPIPDRDFG
jgi:DNA polymerase